MPFQLSLTDTDGEVPVPAYFDFTPDILATLPLNELSAALMAVVDAIILSWSAEITASVPAARRLPFDKVADGTPPILRALAEALGSTDPEVRKELLKRSPAQGITRFQQHYNPRDLLFEDRQLRRHSHRHIESALGREMNTEENVAVGMGLDLMTQQAVCAFIEHQDELVRAANEAELRYLSFLSHDLNNNLNGVTLWLQVLRAQLEARGDMRSEIDSIATIQETILRTIGGMGRLLQAERLRHEGSDAQLRRIELRSFVTNQTRTAAALALERHIEILVDVPNTASAVTDPDLLTLILQNVVGNAVKFASPGFVRIAAHSSAAIDGREQWSIAITDNGPGIAPEQVGRIFRAFQRGTLEGNTGVGLGLAIASRAAAKLGGTLGVESRVGEGSTFTLTLPPS